MKFLLSMVAVLSLSACSSKLVQEQETIRFNWSELESAQFVEGMKGAENIYLSDESSRVYITDLQGNIYLLEENPEGELEIRSSLKIGNRVLGITKGRDGSLYVNASDYDEAGWLETGGEVYQVDPDLQSFTRFSATYKGINGLASTVTGDLYFATGNMSMFSPQGAIYKIPYDAGLQQYGEPELIDSGLRSANGLYYSAYYNALFFTETFTKVAMLDMQSNTVEELFGKTRIVEGFDDLCVDSIGRIWVAEPVAGFLKVYERDTMKLTRIHVDGLGVASSCRIGFRNGEETIYVTERQIDNKDDGRGVAVISIKDLL